MSLSRKEIQSSVLNTTRQNATQIGNLVNEFINLTLHEINDPAWAFPRKQFTHAWNFLRRKTSISVSAEDYVLGREVDRIALVRQEDTPIKLRQIPDELFYRFVPEPTATGNPHFYRIWEREGVATKLGTADTIDVVSDSSSDSGDSALAVSVSGYVGGIWRTETFQLNGTTTVTGSLTFQAREVFVSKQSDTTGTITVTENSGGTTLVTLGPRERNPRFKVISFYPIPSSSQTLYIEYYTRIPELENDSDVPGFDGKWHYVVRLGTLSKVYQYLNKEADFTITQSMYAGAVRSMVSADKSNPDIIEELTPSRSIFPIISQIRDDTVTS